MALIELGTGLARMYRLLVPAILFSVMVLAIACEADATATPTPTLSPTATPTLSPTATPTTVPQPTSTPTLPPQTPPSSQATSTPTSTAAPTPSPTPTITASPTPSPTPSLFPLVITDSNGNDVTFDKPPERIIAYDSGIVEILFPIGEGARIAGTHDFVTYPPETADIPKVGSAFSINTEKIVELEPDLIYTFFPGSLPDLENLGIKVLYQEQPNDVDEISERIRMWGRLTDNVAGAEKVAKDFEARVKALVDRLASLEEGPRVFHDLSSFFTAGHDTLVGRIYTLLKAQNIAHDISGFPQLSQEVIVERDPQVVIVTFPDTLQVYKDNPALQNISAVRDGRVHAVEGDLISVAGPRTVDGIELLAKLLYPDVFP